MKDYQEVVDKLRSAVAAPGEFTPEELEELAKQYAELCFQANERIGECFRLVRAGQTAEAARQADLAPRLLELVGALDFPEREQWVTLCQFLQLPLPPPLLLDRAAALNDIYDSTRSLEMVLRRWRFENVARAPLARRMATLRLVASLDPVNVAWRDDLREFEERRLREIQQELKTAARNEDWEQLLAIERELAGGSWTIPVPHSIRVLASQIISDVKRKRAQRRVTEVAEQLHEAYSRGLADKASELAKEFVDLRIELGLAEDDPVCVQVEPALHWLKERLREREEKRRQESAVAALERALDNEQTLPEVVKLHETATRDGSSLPVDLERRYRLYCASAEAAARRRHVITISAIAGTTTLLAVVSVIIIMLVTQSQNAGRTAELLRTYVSHFQFEEAEKYLDQIRNRKPDILRNPEVAAALAEYEAAYQKERDRRENFTELAQRLLREAADGDPSLTDLERLRTLARSEDEKIKVEEISQQVNSRKQILAQQRLRQWQEEYSRYEAQLKAWEEMPLDQVPEPTLGELRRSIAGLGNRQDIPESVTSSTNSLLVRVQRLQERLQAHREDQARLRRLLTTIGQPQAYAEALKEVASADREHGQEYAKVADTLPFATVAQWNLLVDDWNARASQFTPTDAAALVNQFTEIPDLAKELSGGRVQQKILPHLTCLAKRDPDSLSGIVRHWQSSLVSESFTYCVRIRTNNRLRVIYSLTPPPPQFPQSMGIAPLQGPLNQDLVSASSMESIRQADLMYVGQSSPCLLKQRLNRELKAVTADPVHLEANVAQLFSQMIMVNAEFKANWQKAIQETSPESSSKNTDTPPPLNSAVFAYLLLTTLDAACELSYPMKTIWASHFDELRNEAEAAYPKWLEYECVDSSSPNRLEALLPTEQKCNELAQQTQKELESIWQPLPSLECIGFASYDRAGAPSLHVKTDAKLTSSTLYLFRPSLNRNSPPSLVRLATVDDKGALRWEITNFLRGTPVFRATTSRTSL